MPAQAAQRRRCHFLHRRSGGHCDPAVTMLGFNSMPSSMTRCSASALKTARRTEPVICSQRSIFVSALHQHFRLDNRHQPLFLTQSRVSCEGMGIGADAGCARHPVADADHRPPLRKAGAEARDIRRADCAARRALPSRFPPGHPASDRAPVSTSIPGMTPCSREQFRSATPAAPF